MNFTNMNIKTFIEHIITFENIDDIFDECETQILFKKNVLSYIISLSCILTIKIQIWIL